MASSIYFQQAKSAYVQNYMHINEQLNVFFISSILHVHSLLAHYTQFRLQDLNLGKKQTKKTLVCVCVCVCPVSEI